MIRGLAHVEGWIFDFDNSLYPHSSNLFASIDERMGAYIQRLLFFAGHSRGTPFRALGFTLTFYPTVGLFLLVLPAAVRHLFAAL